MHPSLVWPAHHWEYSKIFSERVIRYTIETLSLSPSLITCYHFSQEIPLTLFYFLIFTGSKKPVMSRLIETKPRLTTKKLSVKMVHSQMSHKQGWNAYFPRKFWELRHNKRLTVKWYDREVDLHGSLDHWIDDARLCILVMTRRDYEYDKWHHLYELTAPKWRLESHKLNYSHNCQMKT